MNATLNEVATSVPAGGRMHSVEGQETLGVLNVWLRRNPYARYHDRLIAQSLAKQPSLVLSGPW